MERASSHLCCGGGGFATAAKWSDLLLLDNVTLRKKRQLLHLLHGFIILHYGVFPTCMAVAYSRLRTPQSLLPPFHSVIYLPVCMCELFSLFLLFLLRWRFFHPAAPPRAPFFAATSWCICLCTQRPFAMGWTPPGRRAARTGFLWSGLIQFARAVESPSSDYVALLHSQHFSCARSATVSRSPTLGCMKTLGPLRGQLRQQGGPRLQVCQKRT